MLYFNIPKLEHYYYLIVKKQNNVDDEYKLLPQPSSFKHFTLFLRFIFLSLNKNPGKS